MAAPYFVVRGEYDGGMRDTQPYGIARHAAALSCIALLEGTGFLGCGGMTNGRSDDGGAGEAEHSDWPADGGASPDSLPSPDSSECVVSSGTTCVLCNDGNWHCDALVLPTCPAGVTSGAPCSDALPICFACNSDDSGAEWRCSTEWEAVGKFSCAP